jgi:hypothetical protein
LEKGQEAPGLEEGVRALDGFERASRLALFLWNQAPNEALLEKAKAGLLDTDEGVRETARQMLKEPMAATVVKKFIVDLLGLNGGMILPALEQIEKDSERFPQFDEDLLKAMRTEIEAFAEKVLLSDGGSYRALWDNNQAYVNRELAELYGVGFDTSGEEFQWLDLPNNQRAGLLTRAAFLALYAHSSHQSPILRGAHILSDVFCQPPGSPPPDVDDSPIAPKKSDASAVSSVRDSTTERTQGPECEGCHIRINNTGFAFDHYDALGAWQDKEKHLDTEGVVHEIAVDASGDLPQTDVVGELYGAITVSERVASSVTARHCFSKKWHEKALGAAWRPQNKCTPYEAQEKLGQDDDFESFILNVVTSDAFLFVSDESEEG